MSESPSSYAVKGLSESEGSGWSDSAMAKSPTARVFFCSPKGEQKKTREVSVANDERPKKRIKVEQEICGNKGSKKLLVSQRPKQRFL